MFLTIPQYIYACVHTSHYTMILKLGFVIALLEICIFLFSNIYLNIYSIRLALGATLNTVSNNRNQENHTETEKYSQEVKTSVASRNITSPPF